MRYLAVLLLVLAVRAIAQPMVPPEQDISKVSTVLQFDKPTFFLGENIVGYFGVVNTGATDVTITYGGDYRGAPRPLRFIVVAVDANGKRVEDPYASVNCMGGLTGPRLVKPGTTHWMPLSLPRYCHFTTPGTYTVTVYHDLGWDPQHPMPVEVGRALPTGQHAAPVATGTITLKMPTAAQARQVAAIMATLPESFTYGERKPYADYFAMRYPIYLPMLTELAKQGHARAVEAIAAMPAPEATPVLARLAGSAPPEGARMAFWGMLGRIPAPAGHAPWGNVLRGFPTVVWKEGLAPELRAAAWQWLASADRQRLNRGGEVLLRVGTKDDLPRLLPVLDRALTATADIPEEQEAFLTTETACWALRHAVDVLLGRGGAVPARPRTTAERLCLLRAVALQPTVRPAGWQEAAAALLASPIPFVRMTALESLPTPLEPRFLAPAAAGLRGTHVAVHYAAASLAARAKAPELGDAALDLLAVATEHFVINAAYRAAIAGGVARDRRIAACIRRLDDPKVTYQYYGLLMELIAPWYLASYSGELTKEDAATLRAAWEAFFAAHREAIRDGAVFDVEQPPFTRALVPPGATVYHSAAHRHWPPRADPAPG